MFPYVPSRELPLEQKIPQRSGIRSLIQAQNTHIRPQRAPRSRDNEHLEPNMSPNGTWQHTPCSILRCRSGWQPQSGHPVSQPISIWITGEYIWPERHLLITWSILNIGLRTEQFCSRGENTLWYALSIRTTLVSKDIWYFVHRIKK